MVDQVILQSVNRLQQYIEANDYKGFDPYDALNSPLFRIPFFRKQKQVRFLSQQFIKRIPINLRHFLLIKKEVNPVTLGLCLQAYSYLSKLNPQNSIVQNKICKLIDRLELLVPSGFHGVCWGYNFDWEARYAAIKAYMPTVVATGIISNALFTAYQIAGYDKAKSMVVSAAEFVIADLRKTVDSESELCFSYSPFDNQKVFNASMKGARILAQAYHLTNDLKYKTEAEKAVRFVVNNQNESGSWYYSLAKTGDWIDNYHTGYILDCLHDYQFLTNDYRFDEHLKKGFSYYKANFFDKEYQPRFYNTNTYPLDCTSAAQSLLTLCRFGEVELARKVAIAFIEKMQHYSGYFYFRRYRYFVNKTSFMRWSNAWMFAGISFLFLSLNSFPADE